MLNVSTDEVATPKTSSITLCFMCLEWDHAEVGVQQPPSCSECGHLHCVDDSSCWFQFLPVQREFAVQHEWARDGYRLQLLLVILLTWCHSTPKLACLYISLGGLTGVGGPVPERGDKEVPCPPEPVSSDRAGFTSACYRVKKLGLQTWCEDRQPYTLKYPDTFVISFLQCFLDRGLSRATIKVYASAIYSCHKGFGDGSTSAQEKVARGTCCLATL